MLGNNSENDFPKDSEQQLENIASGCFWWEYYAGSGLLEINRYLAKQEIRDCYCHIIGKCRPISLRGIGQFIYNQLPFE